MKKALILVMILAFVLLPAVESQSASIKTKYWKTWSIDNNAGARLTTNVSIVDIRPNVDKILGFCVIGLETDNSQELIGFMYDAVAGGELDSLLGEVETIEESVNGMWFPYPRQLANGLTITQGAYTSVIVYYE